jgi:hypothetical protein
MREEWKERKQKIFEEDSEQIQFIEWYNVGTILGQKLQDKTLWIPGQKSTTNPIQVHGKTVTKSGTREKIKHKSL